MSETDTDTPHWLVEKRAREAKTEGPFRELCSPYLGLRGYGHGVPAADRLERAEWARLEFRRARGQQTNMGREDVTMAVRIVADTMASEISAAAGDEQDSVTVAWVLAGLRCPSRPFCTGCPSCQTITSPTRPAEPISQRRI